MVEPRGTPAGSASGSNLHLLAFGDRYPDADVYFAVFGAMIKGSDVEVDFEDLTSAGIMTAVRFKAVLIAATMSTPGIESPLELR